MRFLTTLSVILVTFVISAPGAFGQVVITSPVANQVFSAGPDYATDVLHDPWDFANAEDISDHPDDYLGWVESAEARVQGRAAFLKSGRFSARSNSNDPMIGLLSAGHYRTVPSARSGDRFPVDTSRFSKIAVKLSVSGGQGGIAVHWFFGPKGIDTGSTAFGPAVSSDEQIYSLDLAAHHVGGSPFSSKPLVQGLRLDPTSDNGANVQVDWVRLTAADGAPGAAMMPVQASSCAGAYTVSVLDSTSMVTMVSGSSSNGHVSTAINYGILPPGGYTLRLACGSQTSDVPFVINDPPRVTITSPSTVTGADYASAVLQNPWDMEDQADFNGSSNITSLQLVPSPSGGSMVRGVNVSRPGDPNAQGDPSFFLLADPNNSTPIATSRYRYLTFDMQLEHPFDLAGGSVARLAYCTRLTFDGTSATMTKDILVLPGRNTYTIDMASLVPGDTLEPGPVSESWALRSVRFLRLDPHEFGYVQVPFSVDNVKLTAPDEVALGSTFQIRWKIADGNGGSRAARVFLDTDKNPSSGMALIGQGISADRGTFDWQAANVAPGLYYVYVEVTDSNGGAVDVRGTYSAALLRVTSPSAPVTSITSPISGARAFTGFALTGCAYDASAPSGTGVDEIMAYAIGGPSGTAVHLLGALPTGEWGTPMATGLPCPGASAQFANTGFAVNNIFGLPPGVWSFRVLARNVASGNFEQALATNVVIDWNSPPARNLRLTSTSGNTVALAWDPPVGGRPVTAYRIEVATNPNFAPLAAQVQVPPSATGGSGALGNGAWYVRVITESAYSNQGPYSNVLTISLPHGVTPTQPPGQPVLTPIQVSVNPATFSWAPGPGGSPTNYTLYAGTRPGSSDLGVFPAGLSRGIQATAPTRLTVYLRIVASNAAGSATSNEVVFTVGGVGPPPAPGMHAPSVSGRDVRLSWSTAVGASSYTVLARFPGSAAIVATLPGQTGNSAFVQNVPPGTYVVTTISVNAAGQSAESNQVTVVVP